jgi:pimeloyl-ACP methyl ester carboxylesterase
VYGRNPRDPWRTPPQSEDSYLGMSWWVFDFFVIAAFVAGAVAIWVFLFDAAGSGSIFGGDDDDDPAAVAGASPTDAPTELPTAAPTAVPETPPPAEHGRFVESRCWTDRLGRAEMTCGQLIVPADRERPESGEVRLAVQVFHARSNDPAQDPIIYLDGGPGGHTLEALPLVFSQLVDPFLDDRDFIVFDQRGLGYSEPAMECKNVIEFETEAFEEGLTGEEYNARSIEEIAACRAGLEADGVDWDHANSAESAADLEALRIALGYEQWNLYGISYGTRLALTVLRDYPEGVRSVVLDSVFPVEEDLPSSTPDSFARALGVLVADCAADDECGEDYPDLESTLFATAEELTADPQEVELGLLGALLPLDTVVLDGGAFLGLVHQALYSSELIPMLPEIIYQVADGDYETAGLLIASLAEQQQEYFSLGMYLSVQCAEDVPFVSEEAAVAAIASHPELAPAYEGEPEYTFAACEAWAAEPAPPIEDEPVSSDVPALVLAGHYDPITPPEWGAQVAGTLSTAHYFEFPGDGHAVSLASDCAEEIMRGFLDDPDATPPSECVADLGPPDFGFGFPFPF